MTRGTLALVHGDVLRSLAFNPGAVAIAPVRARIDGAEASAAITGATAARAKAKVPTPQNRSAI